MENPFVFDRPNNITVEEFVNFYIKDNIYTRFLESTRNIILIGVRGSGKTSTLRYYSFPVRLANPEVDDKYSIIGIHIPSKHPLFGKREFLLYEKQHKKNVVVEHFLCINIIVQICDTLNLTKKDLGISLDNEKDIISNLNFILGSDIPESKPLFEAIKLYLNKELNASQRKLNSDDFESFIDLSFSFNNTVIPFLEQIRKIEKLEQSHFSLFFDDVQDLGDIHREIINSWIAYRDNSLFSFKIATADIKLQYSTSTGGVILEGHDFVKIDLTRRLFSKDSEFNRFAKDVINRRLELANINKTVDEFLPESSNFKKGLEEGKIKARKLASEKFPSPKGTQITDYVAKYGRAIYFRDKNPKSNKPVYSGFETLVDISTGVIRNLLTPVYFMYEKQYSSNNEKKVTEITPSIQRDIILNRSEAFWEKIRGIDSEIEDCTVELSDAINNFFNQLMIFLKKRLKDETISEPRALNFILSQESEVYKEQVDKIINSCLKSTLLYKRMVGHKSTGEQLALFVPNRLMLPSHGLDPHGQYSHFPITYKAFAEAAYLNKEIPFFADTKSDEQLEIFF
ncbi:hypothetical protein [uncultured Christiangramia sp.]|uniref:ORC-CDC6 family AAA ATPase n=1 Tax=uncultured Christiangramia sp. TaxID=503836 RepID=UPI0026168568|nr:hypothetical protein [uncultured Christiangramia sp.]